MQGLLLITVRRPFDLGELFEQYSIYGSFMLTKAKGSLKIQIISGDRIVIVGPESSEKQNPIESYFVEDIALMKTTIRYARTNEVSTINNFAISKSRIINYQRSLNATIFFDLKFSISAIFEGDKHQKYRFLLEDYVRDHPRNWECLDYMRHDEFNADWGYVIFRFSFRHRYTWQNAGIIMIHRAELLRYMQEKGVELGIHYFTPLPYRAMYDGSGTLLFSPDRLNPAK
jgi:hypothetical protein